MSHGFNEAYRPEDEPMGGLFADPAPSFQEAVAVTEPEEEQVIVAPDDNTPAVGAVTLRSYQEECVSSIINQYRQKVMATLAVSATGTGKAVMLAELARRVSEKDHGVLILVHRDELIRQLVKSCGRLGIPALVEKAQERAQRPYAMGLSRVVVASKDTLRGKRIQEWPRDSFKLCIIDECHHALMTNGYGEILRHFGFEDGRLRVAGFTATADRLDGENIGQIFETLAFEYNIQSATRDGWLVPVEAVQLKTDPQIDLRDLRITAGDFNQGDLERAVQDNIGVLVNSLVDTNALQDRRTICFTPNIQSAQALAEAMSHVGISARAVWGQDPQRDHKFKAHQRGDFQVLCNCAIATEGYDDPAISAVLICRPTKSRALYSQMVGRGTRLHPESGKTNCRIVDFAFITGKHRLVCPVDLYDNSERPDEVVEEARELLAAGRASSIDEALEQAEVEYEAQRRVRIQRRMTQVQATKFNPLDACELFGIPQKAGYDWGNTEPATAKQVETLQKMGIDATPDMGKGAASKLLNKLFARKEHGWASPWQVRDLIRAGLDPQTATGMRQEAARGYLEANPLGPSDKQIKFLKWKGVSDAEIATMTKKQASERISAIKETEG